MLSQKAVDELGLERRFLARVVTNAKDVPHFDINYADWLDLRRRGRPVWLVSIPRGQQNLTEEVVRYIRQGEEVGFDRCYLTHKRKRWFSVEQRLPAPILFTSMFARRLRFILSKTCLKSLNTLHCIYPDKTVFGNPEATKALLAYLNSSFGHESVKACARSYGKGTGRCRQNCEADGRYTLLLAGIPGSSGCPSHMLSWSAGEL